jgi:hypothetical protein
MAEAATGEVAKIRPSKSVGALKTDQQRDLEAQREAEAVAEAEAAMVAARALRR